MKRILTTMLASAFALCLNAQNYEPTSTWPYIYPEFTEGTLSFNVSGEREGLYNIHILEDRLHFIDGEIIREASPDDVYSVKIGNEIYLNAGGTMMKVLAQSEAGVVLQETIVDKVKLNSSGAAYGASSNSMATRSLSSLERTGSMTNINHMELKNARNDGEILPVARKIYLMSGGKLMLASRKDVTEAVGAPAMKAFLKTHKIKWKDPQSLLLVVDFLSEGASGIK